MLDQISGLPAHVLLIHVLVVFGPLGALFTILSAVWPRARRKLGVITPITCAIVLIFTPITQNAGEWLEHKLERNGADPAIAKHAELGETFLWFALALFVVSVAVWWLGRMSDAPASPAAESSTLQAPAAGGGAGTATLVRPEATAATLRLPTWVHHVLAVVAVAISLLVVWQLYRIGDSGARAAWDYVQHLK